jgi:hypothetical protein
MLQSLRRHRPSPAMVIAVLALVGAFGGSAIADNAVDFARSKLVNGKKIKKRTISGNRLKRNTVTGKEVAESKLGKVPKATNADNATNATNATNAGNADKLDSKDSSEFLQSGQVRADGAADSTAIDDFTSATYTDVISKTFTAPKNGLIMIVGTLSTQDDASLGGAGVLSYRLALDGTGLSDSTFYHQLFATSNSQGDSGAASAVVSVTAGDHTVSLQALETGTGDFIRGRDLSIMFAPNGSGVTFPF